MTKFVLHGGGEMQRNEKHDAFFREFLKDFAKKSKILLVYFAIPDEEVKIKHPVYEDYFKRNGASKSLKIKIATYDNFINEIKWADAVYFRGGDTFRLLGAVGQYSDFKKELIKKKVVAGSSAGVYFLSMFAFSRSRKIIYKGLGILPIKVNCHYSPGKKGVIKMLSSYPGKLVLLREGNFTVMHK